jgi:hypothetical protein
MESNDPAAETAETDGSAGTGDSREQGVDIGPLADELEDHTYPATTSEIIEEYGDYEIELPDGSQSLSEVLGGLEGEDEEYESADEVRQMIYNMVGSEAVGREGYSDRGGTSTDAEGDSEESEEENQSF